MGSTKQRIRVMAGTPVEAGERRLLPSVLVTTVEGGDAASGLFRYVRMRPISLVVEGPDGARWIEIEDATGQALSGMLAAGAALAALSLLLIVFIRLMRTR